MPILMTTLDTYELIKELKEEGYTELEAERQARFAKLILGHVAEQYQELSRLRETATLQDMKQIGSELSAKIEKIYSDTELEKERINCAFQLESQKTRAEIQKVYAEIEKVRAEVYKTKNSLIMWVVGIIGAQTAFIFGFFGKALNLF